jgi:hypothetical protein
MKILVLVAVVVGALTTASGVLDAANVAVRHDAPVVMTGEGPGDEGLTGEVSTTASDDDDDTVAVQLVVLGIVIATVFVIGTAAYGLRWKLGRTEYTPPPDVGHH